MQFLSFLCFFKRCDFCDRIPRQLLTHLQTTGLYQYYVKGFFNGITAEVAYYVLSLDNKYRRDWDAYALEVDSIDTVEGSDCVYWACKNCTQVHERFIDCFQANFLGQCQTETTCFGEKENLIKTCILLSAKQESTTKSQVLR
jgi:hypothetical protein